MRRIAFALFCGFALMGQGNVETFPGAKIRNEAPYNQTTMSIGQTVCSKIYTDQELITQKLKIVPDIKECMQSKYSALASVDFAFGTSQHDKCVVPDHPIKSSGGLPMWPVCCPIGQTNAHQFLCVSYVVPGGGG